MIDKNCMCKFTCNSNEYGLLYISFSEILSHDAPLFQCFAPSIIFRSAGTVPHFPHRAAFIKETCATLDRTLSTTYKVNCYSLYYGF